MSIVVVCVDGVPVHLLGAYGNTSFPTLAIDSMAARGFVLERAFVSGDAAVRQSEIVSWLNSYHAAGWQTLRFTLESEEQPTELPVDLAEEFETIVLPAVDPQVPAEDWTECATSIFISQVLAQLDVINAGLPKCIWIDLPLMKTAWDAPVEWRERLVGEDDPEVLDGVQQPQIGDWQQQADLQVLDPDLRLIWEQAASAQVMLLDQCVEVLQQWVADAWPDASLLLTAHQGYGLGEHGFISSGQDCVHSEVTQVPWILSTPGQPSGVRVPGIQNQRDWLQLICDLQLCEECSDGSTRKFDMTSVEAESQRRFHWCQYSLFAQGEDQLPGRRAVISWSPHQVAVRTDQWTFIWTKDKRVQLFVSPDDRFEQNDVADRCRSLANLFLRHMAKFGVCLFPELSEVWWADADETLPVTDSELDKSAEGEMGDDSDSDQLSQLPGDFWTAAI